MKHPQTTPTTPQESSAVEFQGFQFREGWEDGERRVRDIEVATRLGYARPRAIRQLIKSLEIEGLLANVAQSHEAGRRSDGMPVKTAHVYWLTMVEAIMVSGRSQTAAAHAVSREVAEVFAALIRGQTRPRFLALEPCPWSRMWGPEICRALCALYGIDHRGSRPHPVLAQMFMQLYTMVFGKDGYAEIKRINPDPTNGPCHHQLIAEPYRSQFSMYIPTITHTAWIATRLPKSVTAFWELMNHPQVGGGLQLPMFGIEPRQAKLPI